MKTHYHLLIAVIAVALFMVPIFAGVITSDMPLGSGTSLDPYKIATLNNLHWITQNSSS